MWRTNKESKLKTNNMFRFKTNIIILLLAPLFLFFASCENDDPISPKPTSNRTVIVYMAGENTISWYMQKNMNDMQSVFDNDNYNLIVYADLRNQVPAIYQITTQGTKEIKVYEENQNSADEKTLNLVLEDIISLYPNQEYGLILASHATSWLPPKISVRSFGDDLGREMDIMKMEAALPVKFEYILFDACLMSGVEIGYQLKDKAKYLIAAPTEVLIDGFPYDKITPHLWGDVESLKTIADIYYKHYLNQNSSATVTVTDLSGMDKLATLTKELITTYPLTKWDYKQNEIQRFDTNPTVYAYDFIDFLEKNYPDEAINPIREQFARIILYENHTSRFLNKFEIKLCNGLSCYVPSKSNFLNNNYYLSLPWAEASGFSELF